MESLKNFLNLFSKDIKKDWKKMKGSEFVFNNVDLFYYKFHKVSLKTMMKNAFNIP